MHLGLNFDALLFIYDTMMNAVGDGGDDRIKKKNKRKMMMVTMMMMKIHGILFFFFFPYVSQAYKKSQ